MRTPFRRHRNEAQHPWPPPGGWPPPGRPHRHRKPPRISSALRRTPARFAAGATALAVITASAVAAHYWTRAAARPQAADQTRAFTTLGAGSYQGAQFSLRATPAPSASPRGSRPGSATSKASPRATSSHAKASPSHAKASPSPAKASPSPAQASPSPTPGSGYANPFRAVQGLLPERIDQGVDFGGSGPVFALGNAVIIGASSGNSGWPGGGWITYRLTSGPASGLTVFLAEDVTPTVQAGQQVTSSTVIANMFNGGDGIETGWATADGLTAESQLPEAGGVSGNGPFPTQIGQNFEELLVSVGVPASFNRYWGGSGMVPSQYPQTW